jgi:aminopeptidase N
MQRIVLLLLCLALHSKAQIHYTYQNAHFTIDPNVKFISGNVTFCFNTLSITDTLVLNLSSTLVIDSIVYHNQNITSYFFEPPDYFNVILPQNALAYDSIKIAYHGVPSTSGLGSFSQSFHNNVPIISTLSQPYGASDWMPSINNLRQKFDSIKTTITCPNNYTAVTNGRLKSTVVNGTNKTFIYKHNYPIATYLFGISVTNYVRQTLNFVDGVTSFPIENYVYPEEQSSWMNGVQQLPSVMHLFDSLFGGYPFKNEQYGMAQTNYAGGMEHQGITFMGSYNYEISAHELAHHWFGNKVTCGSWHDLWLNEGFATYLSGLAYQYLQNGIYWKPFLEGRMGSATELSEGSVYIDDTTSIDRMFNDKLTYNKAAMVLHQLRYIIGDSAFFNACRNYLNDSNLAYGFAFTSDLKQHFEASSGLDLSYYFNQWIYGEGYPTYNIATSDIGNGITEVHINYTASAASTPMFKLPVQIKFIGQNTDSTIVFNCENTTENFQVQLGFVPQQFICDPELNIIAKSNVMLSINEFQSKKDCSVFPTMTNGNLNITYSNKYNQYQIVNCSGAIVKYGSIKSSISVSDLEKGMYFFKLMGNNTSENFKFIKQ